LAALLAVSPAVTVVEVAPAVASTAKGLGEVHSAGQAVPSGLVELLEAEARLAQVGRRPVVEHRAWAVQPSVAAGRAACFLARVGRLQSVQGGERERAVLQQMAAP
jgi:ribosomal protein S12 methylthiotransferase accessory factor YcaO